MSAVSIPLPHGLCGRVNEHWHTHIGTDTDTDTTLIQTKKGPNEQQDRFGNWVLFLLLSFKRNSCCLYFFCSSLHCPNQSISLCVTVLFLLKQVTTTNANHCCLSLLRSKHRLLKFSIFWYWSSIIIDHIIS